MSEPALSRLNRLMTLAKHYDANRDPAQAMSYYRLAAGAALAVVQECVEEMDIHAREAVRAAATPGAGGA